MPACAAGNYQIMSEKSLDVSWDAIAKVFIAMAIFYILFVARDVVIWFFFALIISILIEPAIRFLRWLKIPRLLSVILIYLSIFGILGAMIYLTAPIFIVELTQLSHNIPEYFEKINPILKSLGFEFAQNFSDFTTDLVTGLKESSGSILRALTVFFGGISAALFIFTLAFFISLEENGIENIVALLTPKKYEEYAVALFKRAQFMVSGWFGARILACIFVGVASFVVFFFLGTKYAFMLALLSGVLNFVPYVGPAIILILSALFVGTSQSWLVAIYVLVALLVIQEIENKAITPMLMKKFIDLPPFLVLISLLIGHAVFGFLGTVFSVPIFGILYEFSKEFLYKKKEEIQN